MVPVRRIDGRTIGGALPGPMVGRLQQLYQDMAARDVMMRDGELLA